SGVASAAAARLGAVEGRPTLVPCPTPPFAAGARARRHRRTHGREESGMSGEDKPPRFPLGGEERAHSLETAALLTLAAALAGGSGLWFTGEVAARLSAGTCPAIPPAEMGRVLVHFRAHVGDPAAAWPASQRTSIPGPAAFYATLAAILVPFVVA